MRAVNESNPKPASRRNQNKKTVFPRRALAPCHPKPQVKRRSVVIFRPSKQKKKEPLETMVQNILILLPFLPSGPSPNPGPAISRCQGRWCSTRGWVRERW